MGGAGQGRLPAPLPLRLGPEPYSARRLFHVLRSRRAHPGQHPAVALAHPPPRVMLDRVVTPAEICKVVSRCWSAVLGSYRVVNVASSHWYATAGGPAMQVSRCKEPLNCRSRSIPVDAEDGAATIDRYCVPRTGGARNSLGGTPRDRPIPDQFSDGLTGRRLRTSGRWLRAGFEAGTEADCRARHDDLNVGAYPARPAVG